MDSPSPSDFRGILETLIRHDVDFTVIGSMAGNAHGSTRATYDVDIMYSRAAENLDRLANALRELDARLSGPNVPDDLPFQLDGETLRRGANFTFQTRLGRCDILAEPSGAPAYDVVRSEAINSAIAGFEVPIASLDHLIAMKRAAGREKDRGDIVEYSAISDELRRRAEQEPPD